MQPSWVKPFRFFCSKLEIDSKETGVGPLNFFGSQEEYVRQIADGLGDGVHHFIILKSRQLGVSTVSIALDLFWCMVNPGIQGAIITHDEASREDFRSKIKRYAKSLPEGMQMQIPKDNRYRLEFSNGSVLNMMVAGTKAKGTLGRAFGLNFVHGTECSSWGDEEGLAALRNSLAEYNPRRLYIFESTARGFNMWNRIWEDSLEDPTVRRFFLGWYWREDQKVDRTDPRFPLYWDGEYSQEEQEKVKAVDARYGKSISPEQIVWYRWKMQNIGDDILGMQEQPWTEEEAFIMSGSPFFSIRALTKRMNIVVDKPFKAYRYILGNDFLATQMEPVERASQADLRIWEEPDPNGVYIIGADPAYGSSDTNDRSAAEVYRAYADRLIQVAEFASPLVNTAQFAWIIAHLGGAYRNTVVNLEITGPGQAVWAEILHLRQQMSMGDLGARAADTGLSDLFGSIRWFYYHRPDSLQGNYALHWKTGHDNKRRIMNQTKDSLSLEMLDVNSVPLLTEMQSITIKEGSIGGEGSKKDDRVMATALAVVTWADTIRKQMISQGRTWEVEKRREEAKAEGKPYISITQAIVADVFRRKAIERAEEATQIYRKYAP